MKQLLFFTLMFTLQISAHAQDAFSTLEERMSGKEFKQTGLGKLTDEELAALNEWVRSHSVATLENAAARPTSAAASTDSTADLRGFENRPKFDDDDGYGKIIQSNIVGTFTGWDGNNTEFALDNGMIWKQVEDDSFSVRPTQNAAIIIKKGVMGGWRLSMDGYNNSVRVKRIQ